MSTGRLVTMSSVDSGRGSSEDIRDGETWGRKRGKLQQQNRKGTSD